MATYVDPPAYETIMGELAERLGSKPTIQKIIDAVNELPQYERLVVASRPGDDLPKMTDEQKKLFTTGVAKTMSSTEAIVHLQASAAEAVKAVNTVETMFINSTRELAAIDAKNIPPPEGPFTPRLLALHTEFRASLGDSRALAVKISTYGQRFDKIIIPICNDATLTTEQRKAKVDAFILDADQFAEDAKAMTARFDALKGSFAAFTGSFSGWAKAKEGADTAALKQARLDLDDLNSELSRLETALYAMAGITALALPVTGVAAAMAGPFAPFVLIGGLVFAGIALASTIALYAAIQSQKGKVNDKEQEIADLEASIAEIRKTRGNLETLGKNDLVTFSDSLQIISLLWTSVRNDAIQISEWLAQGASDADLPPYMLESVNEAVSIYQTMAIYLRQYADGIVNVSPPSTN